MKRYFKDIIIWVDAENEMDADMFLADFIFGGHKEVQTQHPGEANLSVERDRGWEEDVDMEEP